MRQYPSEWKPPQRKGDICRHIAEQGRYCNPQGDEWGTAYAREVKEELDREAEVENSILSMLMSFNDHDETAC